MTAGGALEPRGAPRSACYNSEVASADAFIHLRRGQDGWSVEGVRNARFGHRLGTGSNDGVFAEWEWTGTELVLRTASGFYPLYYFAGRDELCVSPSIETLIGRGAPTELNDEGIAVFLRIGYYVLDDTPFRAIRAVPVNPAIRLEPTPAVTGCYPRFERSAATREEAVDTYIGLFRQAVESRPPLGRTVLPLSGGRDSRHILFALAEGGHKPDVCATIKHFPPRGNNDVAVAALLAGRLGIRHEVLEAPVDQFGSECEKNRATSYCTDEHAQFLALAHYLGRGVETVYDGIGGDVLSAGHFLRPALVEHVRTGNIRDLVKFFIEGYDNDPIERALARLLGREARARFDRAKADARVTAALEEQLDTPDPISAFFFWNRTRREVALAPYSLLPQTLTAYAPYLDSALLAFLLSLPADLTVDQRLHTDAILRGYPQFAEIPYEQRTLTVDAASSRILARAFAKYALSRWRSRIQNLPYVLSACGRALARGDSSAMWFFNRLTVLLQAESLIG
jgi:hypothetical protein